MPKYNVRRKAQLGLDIKEGGVAIPIAPNMYYMDGRSHDEGGIAIGPNNKNGLEVEGGEVVKVGKNDVKVFSSVPLLRGVSPAQLVMGGANPNKVFKAQEEFKDRNRINDDGTTYEVGGEKIYTPSKSIQRQIQETGRITIGGAPTIGGLRTYGYLRGLSNIRKYGQNVNNLFTKSYNFLNRKLQNLINKNKISVDTAQKYNSAYREFVGETGQNIPKTISLMQDDDIKKAGGIYIKPSKRGTFTAAAKKRGMGVQEFASKVLANKKDYSPAMVKKANFARNASHWKKEYGGDGNVLPEVVVTPRSGYDKIYDASGIIKRKKIAKDILQILPFSGFYSDVIDAITPNGISEPLSTGGAVSSASAYGLAKAKVPFYSIPSLAFKTAMGLPDMANDIYTLYNDIKTPKEEFNRNKKEYGGNMIYTVNGNVKNGLMSARPKAVLGKQRKVEGYGNTIVVGDDTFMLNEDGVYVPVGNVQINKQPKTVRGASGRRDIAYDRQGNRYQRRSDGSLIRVSPEQGNIAISNTIGEVEVNAPDVTKTRSRKQINAATKTNNPRNNPPRQKVEPSFEIGDQTVVNFLRNGNGRYNTQRTPIHSFTPAQKLGLSSYGWSTYNDPNKGYTFRKDVAAVKAGQKSVDEIIGQDLSQINFDNNQSSSTPRKGGTKSTSSKAVVGSKPSKKGADTKYGTPLAEKKKSLYMTGIKNNIITPIRAGMEKIKSPSSTGGGKQSGDGRWIGQYKPVTTADWIGLGSNLAGTVASYFMTKNAINKMPDPIKPIMAQAAKLKTRYNVEPQLTNVRESEQMNRAVVRRNTQSSNTSLAREQRLMNEARGARNVLYGQKENIETQLINQDRMNRQAVAAQNVATYNDYLTRLYAGKVSQNQLRISNINNLLSGLTGSVNNILGTIESRRATNNTLRAIAAANPNVDARLIGGFDYYIDPVTKRKYNKNQQYIGTING